MFTTIHGEGKSGWYFLILLYLLLSYILEKNIFSLQKTHN